MQPNAPLTLVRSHQYLQNLAKGPPKYNLLKSDQDVLLRAEAKYNSRAVLTMAIGLGLGIFAAFRDRRAKMKVFKALRGDQIPIYFRFANGTQEVAPDIAALVKPSRLGSALTYGINGFAGFAVGTVVAHKKVAPAAFYGEIGQDPESMTRIMKALQRSIVDSFREYANDMESLEANEKGLTRKQDGDEIKEDRPEEQEHLQEDVLDT